MTRRAAAPRTRRSTRASCPKLRARWRARRHVKEWQAHFEKPRKKSDEGQCCGSRGSTGSKGGFCKDAGNLRGDARKEGRQHCGAAAAQAIFLIICCPRIERRRYGSWRDAGDEGRHTEGATRVRVA